jgi:uncharacterized membrane protein
VCTFAGGGHARLKVEAACKKFVNNKIKTTNKKKKDKQQKQTHTQTSFLVVVVVVAGLILFSHTSPTPLFFKREQGVQGGREGEGEEVF